jgi:adenosylmethionine-8-amino-7-oxononanoate aminotransferase
LPIRRSAVSSNARNQLVRPLGITVYIMPPYCTTPDDLDHVYEAIDAWPR